MTPDRLKLPLSFDPLRLQNELRRFDEADWIPHFVASNYHGDWSVIPLRGPAGAEHPVMMIYSDPCCAEFADTPFLRRSPYFQEVLASFEFELLAVRLMKLAGGSRILEHRDHDLSVEEGTVRLHIPILTSPDTRFYLNGRKVVMGEGECWYLRLSDPHRVVNEGAVDRIHLVIDAPASDSMRALLSCGAAR